MRVSVVLGGSLRSDLGCGELSLELPEGSTLRQLVDALNERVGTRGGVFQPKDESRFPLMISVDGRDHRFCGGKEMPLSDGMEVYFIAPAVGG